MPTPLPRITNKQARRIFMARQGLCLAPQKRQTKDALHDLIHQLGFVQIDSIRTVERAHHMILFARNQTYRPEHLRQLLEVDRRLFEHWTHDAAIIPTAFHAHWRRRFAQSEDNLRQRWRKWQPVETANGESIGFEDIMDQVKDYVAEHGPTRSRDLKARDAARKSAKNGWWDWHPAKTALEFLWRTGVLSVCHRDNFQKTYDLSERVMPDAAWQAPGQSTGAFIDWACHNALERLGFATSGELAAYWGSIKAGEAKAWCADNLGADLIEVLVESADGTAPKLCFARPDLLDEMESESKPPDRLRVLSPFDPLIRDRKRLLRLFNFDYRIEIFVPEARRKYGYYVFPLLEGDRLIGRIDMKARRDDDVLAVTGLWLEGKIKHSKVRTEKLLAELNRQARFIGMGGILWAPDYLKI